MTQWHVLDPQAEADRQEKVLAERSKWEDPVELTADGQYAVKIDGVTVEVLSNRNAAMWRHAQLIKENER